MDNSEENKPKSEEALARELIDALDKAIDKGPWEKGLIFQNIGKQLKDLREQCVTHLKVSAPTTQQARQRSQRPAEASGDCRTVYISLYMSQGDDMSKWEKLLRNIQNQATTRPIYKDEEELRTMLRAKADKTNEAYVAIMVKNQDVMPPPSGDTPTDKLGHDLLILKPEAIKADNIVDFMHKSGHYAFENNQLSRLGDQEHLDFL